MPYLTAAALAAGQWPAARPQAVDEAHRAGVGQAQHLSQLVDGGMAGVASVGGVG